MFPSNVIDRSLLLGFFLGLWWTGSELAFSQMNPVPLQGLSASGTTELRYEPSRIRVSMTVQAEGIDARSAIESLNKQKEKVRESFVQLKADAASIQFEPIAISTSLAGVDSNIRRVNRPGLIGEEEELLPPKIFTAKSVLQAEWEPPTSSAEALAAFPEMLRTHVAERDLLGKKNKAQLTPDEQDQVNDYLRKLATQGISYVSGPSSNSQEVLIYFVAFQNEEKEIQALADAYEIASGNAKRLAQATQQKLLKLTGIQRTIQTDDLGVSNPPIEYDSMGNPTRRRTMKQKSREILATTPQLVQTVTVHLLFSFESAKHP